MIRANNGTVGHTTAPTTSTAKRIRSEDILTLLRRQNFKCALTGQTLTPQTAHLDHIVPLARGGTDAIENLQILHRDVNLAKHTLTVNEFIQLCRDVLNYHDTHNK